MSGVASVQMKTHCVIFTEELDAIRAGRNCMARVNIMKEDPFLSFFPLSIMTEQVSADVNGFVEPFEI